jgi:hypothetical protein
MIRSPPYFRQESRQTTPSVNLSLWSEVDIRFQAASILYAQLLDEESRIPDGVPVVLEFAAPRRRSHSLLDLMLTVTVPIKLKDDFFDPIILHATAATESTNTDETVTGSLEDEPDSSTYAYIRK